MIGFSQRDPRWANERLGTSGWTLGQAGCLVTAAAALCANAGESTDPQLLNELLRRLSGYADDCLFIFSAIDGLGWRFTEFIECSLTPAPVEQIAAALANGAGCLAEVDWSPGGLVEQHWVWVVAAGGLSAPGWRIMDPWQGPGQEFIDLARYLGPGWTPARGIFAAALYSPLDVHERRRTQRAGRPALESHQDAIRVIIARAPKAGGPG